MQEISHKEGLGVTLNNISQIYSVQGDYERALDYLNQSLKIRQEIGDKEGEGVALNNMSLIYGVQGNYERALDYLSRSLQIQEEIGDIAGMCFTVFNIGRNEWLNNNHQAAIQHWLNVYITAKKINLAKILNNLENLAIDIGLTEHMGAKNGLAAWEAWEAWEALCVQNGIDTNTMDDSNNDQHGDIV